MSFELDLRCPACLRVQRAATVAPPWVQLTAWNAEWLDAGADLPAGDVWTQSDTAPRAGEGRKMRVRHPFHASRGEVFWVVYVPALISENGWADAPEEISKAAFARCRLEEVLQREADSAWIAVRVDEVLALAELERRFPAAKGPVAPMVRHARMRQVRHAEWDVIEGNTESDAGIWVIARHAADEVHLLVQEEWWPHEEATCAGHVVLGIEEWAQFCGKL